MRLIERFITNNDCYRNNITKADRRYSTFQTRGPLGLMLHSVGTPQSRAKVFADGWDVSGKDVAVHAVLQADGTVYQCLPWNFRGWHAGGAANDTHVGVEMTEPDQIRYTGGASFTVTDLTAARAQAEGCYRTAVELFAMLCRMYGLPPSAILSHAEGEKQGIASNHADPEHLCRGLGMGYTMDTFRRDVAARLDSASLYRVRKTWADAAGQLGAYQVLQAAVDATPPGYSVFDEDGNAVFSNPISGQEDSEMMDKDQILTALGDRYIRTFDELPDWAKPEMRQMLDRGLINGGNADDPNDINMLLSDLRVAIVAYRAFRMMEDS